MSVATQIKIRDAASKKLEQMEKRARQASQAFQEAESSAMGFQSQSTAGYEAVSQKVSASTTGLDRFNQRQDEASRGASLLGHTWSGIGGYIKTAMAALSIQQGFALSDTLTGNTARLELIVDDGGSVAELENKIYASAMSARASYTDTATAVSKLGLLAGDAFTSNDEIIVFTELMNKNFVIGGAGKTEKASAMYQLTQAMASGRLQGDEYRSIIENAPLLASAIEDYMRNVVGATGSMKDWSAEGIMTSEVIKAALFSTADEVNQRFADMPRTWGEVFTMAGNIAIRALNPLLTGINWIANNIAIIAPLVLGLGGAFLVFQVAAHWTGMATALTGAYQVAVGFLSIGFGMLTGNTAAASSAVFLFNSALLANPITWVVMAVMLLVGALYGGVAAFNKLTDSSISATGIITGAFGVLIAAGMNTFVIPLWNGFATLANFVGNVFNNPLGAIQVLFSEMSLNMLAQVNSVAHGLEDLINLIPGVEVNMTAGMDAFYEHEKKALEGIKDKAGWVDYVEQMAYLDYSDAAQSGYEFGEDIEGKVMGFFGGAGMDFSNDDYTNGIEQIAANTDAMADAVHISDEDLKYLRDVAEMRYVQNFVTLTPTVSMSASVTERADVDELSAQVERKLEEEFYASAEGVYS